MDDIKFSNTSDWQSGYAINHSWITPSGVEVQPGAYCMCGKVQWGDRRDRLRVIEERLDRLYKHLGLED